MKAAQELSLAELEERNHRSHRIRISHGHLNCLTQVRRHIEPEIIERIARSMLKTGQLNPGIVAALTPPQAIEYINYFNDLWGTAHVLSDYIQTRIRTERGCDDYYLFIVAGHQRFMACKWVASGITAKSFELTKHYDGLYRAEMYFGLSAEDALSIQFQENTFNRPPPHDEAFAAWCLWRLEERRGHKPTIARISKLLVRSEDWLRTALRFSRLPESMRMLADRSSETAYVTYGVVAEIARWGERYAELRKKPTTENDFHRIAKLAVLHRWTTARAREFVDEFLEKLSSGQNQLFSEDADVGENRPHRHIFAPAQLLFLRSQIALVEAVRRHDQAGGFAFDSPFLPNGQVGHSPGAPLSEWIRLCALMEELAPHFQNLARRERRFGKRLKASQHAIAPMREAASKLLHTH